MTKLNQLKAAVCGVFDLTEAELIGQSREKKYTHARHVFVGLARGMTDYSMSDIGRYLGRDHTTIHNSERRFKHLCDVNEHFLRRVEKVRAIVLRMSQDSERVERLFDDLGDRLCAGTASQVTRVNRIISRDFGAWVEVRGTIR
jgi:hypothetical protein